MSNTLTNFHLLEYFKKTIARLEEAMSLEKTEEVYSRLSLYAGLLKELAIKLEK